MKKVFIVGSVILILLFIAVCFAKPDVKGVKITPNTDTLCSQIDELEAKYNADCDQLLSEFLTKLENKVSPDFDLANRAVPKVIDDLCGLKVCVKLCCKAAKDKISGSHDFIDAYQTAMDVPIIQPCLHANAVVSDMLQNLQLRLKERHSQYVSDLATVCNNNNSDGKLSPKDLENLQNCLDTFAGTIQELHLKKLVAGAGIALEMIFIRNTCKCIPTAFTAEGKGTSGAFQNRLCAGTKMHRCHFWQYRLNNYAC